MTLFFDTAPATAFLVDDEGLPVWPLDQDLPEFQRLIAGRSVDVREVRGKPGHSTPGDETVVAIGEMAEETARLYAHLTRRRFAGTFSDARRRAVAAASIIVVPQDLLTEAFLDALDALSNRKPRGIISGDASTLRVRAVLHSAASVLPAAAPRRTTIVSPLADRGTFQSEDLTIIGGRSTREEVRAALAMGSGVFALTTHADGVDAYMGRGLLLCARDVDVHADRPPRCAQTSFCHRASMSVDAALQSGNLFLPTDVRAWLAVWGLCWGTLAADGVIHAAWSLGERLRDNASIAAHLFARGVLFFPDDALLRLVQELESGRPIGEAMVRFHRSTPSRSSGARFVLFGDPRTRTPALSRSSPRVRTRVSATRQAAATSDLQFLRLIADDSEHALSLISAYEDRGEEVGREMRDAIFTAIAPCAPVISRRWVPAATMQLLAEAVRSCFVCRSSPLTTYVGHFRERPNGVAPPPRRLSLCPRCGIVEDVPESAAVELAIDNGTVRFVGSLPRENWDALLVARAQNAAETRVWKWPQAGEVPADAFRPADWPHGPLNLGIVLLASSAVMVLGARMRIN
ncbi:MAG TPA: hypothetical protein VF432_09995 [Thermoanaerobaculia bacterium]